MAYQSAATQAWNPIYQGPVAAPAPVVAPAAPPKPVGMLSESTQAWMAANPFKITTDNIHNPSNWFRYASKLPMAEGRTLIEMARKQHKKEDFEGATYLHGMDPYEYYLKDIQHVMQEARKKGYDLNAISTKKAKEYGNEIDRIENAGLYASDDGALGDLVGDFTELSAKNMRMPQQFATGAIKGIGRALGENEGGNGWLHNIAGYGEKLTQAEQENINKHGTGLRQAVGGDVSAGGRTTEQADRGFWRNPYVAPVAAAAASYFGGPWLSKFFGGGVLGGAAAGGTLNAGVSSGLYGESNLGKAFATGAAAGAMGAATQGSDPYGYGTSTAGRAATGATTGALTSAVGQYAGTGQINSRQVLNAAAAGGASAGAGAATGNKIAAGVAGGAVGGALSGGRNGLYQGALGGMMTGAGQQFGGNLGQTAMKQLYAAYLAQQRRV